MLSEKIKKCYKINKMTKIKFNRKGLQKLVRQKKLHEVLIDWYDFYHSSSYINLNKEPENEEEKEELEEIKAWLNDEGKQETPNWSDAYWVGNWCRDRKELNRTAIDYIKDLPSKVDKIYICDQYEKENSVIFIDLKEEKGYDLFLFFN